MLVFKQGTLDAVEKKTKKTYLHSRQIWQFREASGIEARAQKIDLSMSTSLNMNNIPWINIDVKVANCEYGPLKTQ